MRKWPIVPAFILVLAAIAGARPNRRDAGVTEMSAALLIGRLGQPGSSAQRTALARQVSDITASNPEVALGCEDISRLTSFLDDRVGSVQMWTAIALGNLGAKATSAVPALERALARQEALDRKFPVSLSQAAAFEAALWRIGLASKMSADGGTR